MLVDEKIQIIVVETSQFKKLQINLQMSSKFPTTSPFDPKELMEAFFSLPMTRPLKA